MNGEYTEIKTDIQSENETKILELRYRKFNFYGSLLKTPLKIPILCDIIFTSDYLHFNLCKWAFKDSLIHRTLAKSSANSKSYV